jgi:hypothetical protein
MLDWRVVTDLDQNERLRRVRQRTRSAIDAITTGSSMMRLLTILILALFPIVRSRADFIHILGLTALSLIYDAQLTL